MKTPEFRRAEPKDSALVLDFIRALAAYEQMLGLAERYRRLTEGLGEGLEALRDAPGEKAQRAREILAQLLSQEEE